MPLFSPLQLRELCIPFPGQLCRPQAPSNFKRVLPLTCFSLASSAFSSINRPSDLSECVMGLKMLDEEDSFASKILLMRAGNKSKAQSWLKASLGEEKEAQDGTTSCPTEDTAGIFAGLQGNEENSGVGAPKKQNEDDVSLDRQVLGANEALRKKLLSREAYQRYQQGKENKLDASKPMRKIEKDKVEDVSDDEEKGRSGVARPRRSKVDGSASETAEGAHHRVPPRPKKRPGSYLDQLLAERGKRKKSKSEDG